MRICKQSILGFSRDAFLSHASTTFQLAHSATATGNPQLLQRMKEVGLFFERQFCVLRVCVHVRVSVHASHGVPSCCI